MTSAQYVQYVKDDLTAGGVIQLNVKDHVISSYVQDALERVRPWYREVPLFETVAFNAVENQTGYIDVSDLSKTIHVVEELLPIEVHHAGDYVLEEISDLLGLPAGLWDSSSIRNYAEWLQARRQIRKAMGKTMGWRYIPGSSKIYVDDVAWNRTKVTVVFVPLPTTAEEVVYGQAISWVKDWVRAKTLVTWGRVMAKMPDAAANFASLGAANIAEGVAEQSRLGAELKSLQFSYETFARRE